MMAALAPVVAYLLVTGALPAAIRQALLYQAFFGGEVLRRDSLLDIVTSNWSAMWAALGAGWGWQRWVPGVGMLGWAMWAFLVPLRTARQGGLAVAPGAQPAVPTLRA